MKYTLSDEEKDILLRTARTVIRNTLTGKEERLPEPTDNLLEYCGAFVTLHIENRLRGCIGHMTGIEPLFTTVREMAKASAFHDPRFPGLTIEELPSIDIEISVLTPLEKIESAELIEPGRHGIYIQKGSRSGVLLPQVAVEQGWDRETFLRHTCLKAGLHGGCWKDEDTQISIFEAIIFSEQ